MRLDLLRQGLLQRNLQHQFTGRDKKRVTQNQKLIRMVQFDMVYLAL
jgi:hypothetical protein